MSNINSDLKCHTCGFSSSCQEKFKSHCANAHFAKCDYDAVMECTACGYKCGSSVLFHQHLEKKMHKVCFLYMSEKDFFLGETGLAYDTTVKEFGRRNTEKMLMSLEHERTGF
ncbi:hypothetical protein ISTM_291 [Insectomime virus]|uniref:Uncharacterized protein n=1 Tax=Tunisvirus fontaine2 TaxID=1421067 RepID=V9SFT5_9VIRU|nr:hypothetical protein D1R32_gp022 [Tunisvirus fontaine2]AHA46189.1 hypothetical protein ISTM_291 [Insectomime virus]AHC54739.1 hypothetical protein TNS_ORF21 [Tunisvirus fontaine2]